MAPASLDPSLGPSDDPSLDFTRGARLHASVRPARGSARSGRPSPSSPKTDPEISPEAAGEQQGAAPAATCASAPSTRAPKSKSERPASKLVLDLQAVADVEGLQQEVAVLRASIRQLANNDGDMDVHVKVLAELRHQIEALCRALKTQQSLEGPDGDGRTAEMRRVLEELGDDLGVAR